MEIMDTDRKKIASSKFEEERRRRSHSPAGPTEPEVESPTEALPFLRAAQHLVYQQRAAVGKTAQLE